MPAVVLVGVGLDASGHDAALRELADAVGATVAYLQGGSPSLVVELDRLAAEGVAEIRLVRAPAGSSAKARSWVRRVAGDWVRAHPGVQVEVVDRAVTGQEAPLTSPAWEEVPGHRHHVLVCRGPRCAARGSEATAVAVDDALRHHGLGDDDVLVSHTGCLFPCNHAPVVVVHPEDAWHGPVDAVAATRLVSALASGEASGVPQLPRSPSVVEVRAACGEPRDPQPRG